MPPAGLSSDIKNEIEISIKNNHVMVFSKSNCPYCLKIKDLLQHLNVEYKALELDLIKHTDKYQQILKELTGRKTVPLVFIGGKFIGGCDDTLKLHAENKLMPLVQKHSSYDYDLIVIGGGSGGLAAAKEAAGFGRKVALLDFVKPSPKGTTWGLGGTCVNVGCIPKKLMHKASLLGEDLNDAPSFGWDLKPEGIRHRWTEMVQNIQDHIGSLNWNYRVQLRDKDVNYVNAQGEFVGEHTIKATNKKGKSEEMTAEHFIIATGERPRYPDIPGVKEFAITSDDLFSLPYPPGKTLCVGASYVSLECAGFLRGLGFDVTVMVRSILLRGFDQQMANMIGVVMEKQGVKFIREAVPSKIEKIKDGEPGKYRVYAKGNDGKEIVDEYNTILYAIGRDPCTNGIGLEKVGVTLNPKNGRVMVDDHEKTSCPYVYAIGDILDARLQLTPVAIQAGKLLAQRLYDSSPVLCDYINVPTTVFTPLEYGSIGYSEEAAIEKFGAENIEVYHNNFLPLEWTVSHRDPSLCYAKLICLIPEGQRVIGLHVLSPNAGEITQGYAIGMKKGATKFDFDNTIGIHPTCTETFTTLNVTKSSGEATDAGGC